MSRTTPSRLVIASGALVLSSVVLAACGSENGSDTAPAGGIDSITVSGEVGKAPKVTWDGAVAPKEIESEVLTEGDGDVIEAGDGAFAHIWIGNGYDEEEVYNSYDTKAPELLVGDLSKPFKEALEGHKVGSRIAVASSAEDAFGEYGNAQLGIGNKDGVVFVIDLVSRVAGGPSGEDREPAKWAPSLIETDGVITGFDFSKAKAPGTKLLDTYLIKGDGPVVESGQTIAVNYLGQVYDADAPFDESYTKDPTSFPIGIGQVVAGWDKSLVGMPVGTRVILSIPPDEGYGKEGNEGAGIKGTDTLFFVVDILGAV